MARGSKGEFSIRVKTGDYEVEVRGSRGEVLEAIKELPNKVPSFSKAFESLKSREVNVAVKTSIETAVKAESPVERYPKIPRVESCGEALLKVLESDWGKWRPRTVTEIKGALAANDLHFPSRTLVASLLALVRKGLVKCWKTDKGYVYILAEKEVAAQQYGRGRNLHEKS